MNFQMNRWFGWVGEPDMLEEILNTIVDWLDGMLFENATVNGDSGTKDFGELTSWTPVLNR